MFKKYNSDVAKIIKDVERPTFNFPVHPVSRTISNPDGTTTQEKIDEISTCGQRTTN